MIILFLNKCDLLDQKLRSGIKLNHFLTSYGERSNTTGTVVKCTFLFYPPVTFSPLLLCFLFVRFHLLRACAECGWCGVDLRSKFKDILVEKSPRERAFYGYPTSVVDTAATRLTLGSGKYLPSPFVAIWEGGTGADCVVSARRDLEESSEERGFLIAMNDRGLSAFTPISRTRLRCHTSDD